MRNIIAAQNKKLINQYDSPPKTQPCNCRNTNSGPLSGNCREKNIIYQATARSNKSTVRDNSVSITKSATRHRVLLLNFAVRSDTQNPTLILLEQVMLPPLTPDARINTPGSNLNFMKIYCNPNQNVNLVRQLITFNTSKSVTKQYTLAMTKCAA